MLDNNGIRARNTGLDLKLHFKDYKNALLCTKSTDVISIIKSLY